MASGRMQAKLVDAWKSMNDAFKSLIFCFVVYLVCVVEGWQCNSTIHGTVTPATPPLSSLQFTSLGLHCRPEQPAEEQRNLTVYAHSSILPYGASFTGVTVLAIPPGWQTLLLFYDAGNVTLRNVSINIAAPNLTYAITISRSRNVVLDAVIAQNCTLAEGSPSLIRVNGSDNLSIRSSVFADSAAGALQLDNTPTSLLDTVFANLNQTAVTVNNNDGSFFAAQNCTFSRLLGKGIFLARQAGSVANCTFEHCMSESNGGAVYINGDNNEPVRPGRSWDFSVADSVFRNNTSLINGGGVYGAPSNYGALKVSRCTFVENAAKSGGGISTWGIAIVNVTGSTFDRNVAIFFGGGIYAYGYNAKLTFAEVHNTSFRGNVVSKPSESAGARFFSCRCVGVLNCTFEDNIGNGLEIIGADGECERDAKSAVLFRRDTIAGIAGQPAISAFLLEDISIAISADVRNCTFQNHTLPRQPGLLSGVQGGAGLRIQSTKYVVLAQLAFAGNVALQGGALSLDMCSAVVLWGSTFAANSASREGGAVAFVTSHANGLLIGESSFVNNSALSGGALYGDAGAVLAIGNGTLLRGNTAAADGGAVACDRCGQLNLTEVAVEANAAATRGGGLTCKSCITMFVASANLTGNRAEEGGGIYSDGNGVTLASIANSTLVDNKATSFSNNADTGTGDGGAVSLKGGVSYLTGNVLSGNTASRRGGAVAFSYLCFASTKQGSTPGDDSPWLWAGNGSSKAQREDAARAGNCSLLTLAGNRFAGNFASAAGAVLYASAAEGLDLTCLDGSNSSWPVGREDSAECGMWNNSVGSQGYGVVAAFPASSLTVTVRDTRALLRYVSSGETLPQFTVDVSDNFSTLVTAGDNAGEPVIVSLQLSRAQVAQGQQAAQPILVGQIQAPAINGRATFTGLVLRAAPGNYTFNITVPAYPQAQPQQLAVVVRRCISGEVQSSPDTCTRCPAPLYSFNASVTACDVPCPENAICSGGALVMPQPGFWHSAANSAVMVVCPIAAACGGERSLLLTCQNETYGQEADPDIVPSCTLVTRRDDARSSSYMRMQCAAGNYGPLCSLCLKSRHSAGGARYGRTRPLQCQRCEQPAVVLATYAAGALALLGFLLWVVERTVRELAVPLGDVPQASELLRVGIIWLQYIGILSHANVPWPATLRWLFRAIGLLPAASAPTLALDCLVDGGAVQLTLLNLAAPLAALVVLLVGTALWWAARRRLHGRSTAWLQMSGPEGAEPVPGAASPGLRVRLLVTTVTVLFFFYPSLITTTLSIFACYRIEQPTAQTPYPEALRAAWLHGYWIPDMTQECYTGRHLRLVLGLGLPCVLLFCLGIPLVPLLLQLHGRRRRRADPRADGSPNNLAFLHESYRPELWYWESVLLGQTFCLAAAQVFGTALNVQFQVTLMLTVLLVTATMWLRLSPWRVPLVQDLQVLALGTVAATTLGGLYFLNPGHAADSNGLQVLGGLLAAMNVGLLAVLIWHLSGHAVPFVQKSRDSLGAMLESWRGRRSAPRPLGRAADGSLLPAMSLSEVGLVAMQGDGSWRPGTFATLQ